MRNKVFVAAIVLIIIGILLDVTLLRENGSPAWKYFPGYDALFGLVGGSVVIAASFVLGRYWLRRGADYYEKADDND